MNDFRHSPHPLPAAPLDHQAASDLTRAILARTSGSACERLQSLACAYVDGELEADQTTLVDAHLDHCPACAALVEVLAQTQALLPGMAELDPGPWFTQRVLRATVHQPPRPDFDLGRAWSQLMHRPRIALEAAYLGAAASLMGLYLPLPTSSLTTKVPALVQPLIQPLGASAQRIAGRVIQVEQRTTAALQQGRPPLASLQQTAQGAKGLWQRWRARFKARLQAFHQAPSRPVEKKAPPANP
ncbi:MAG TPA: zf-HC2 domain-containing protein [Geothrix sp.]|nr:zf-HC2 domain-containing protein [Geothrix sp.]